MRKWEVELMRFLGNSHPTLARSIAVNNRITDENEKSLREALVAFQDTWQ
jgi:hypothetical protein